MIVLLIEIRPQDRVSVHARRQGVQLHISLILDRLGSFWVGQSDDGTEKAINANRVAIRQKCIILRVWIELHLEHL